MVLLIVVAVVAVVACAAIGGGTVAHQKKLKKRELARREEAARAAAQSQEPAPAAEPAPAPAPVQEQQPAAQPQPIIIQNTAPVQEKKDDVKNCSACHCEMPKSNRFCPNCGKEVDMLGNVVEKPVETKPEPAPAPVAEPVQEKKDETKKCSGCGCAMPTVNRFCPNCGKEVDMLGNVVEKPVETKPEPAPAPVVEPVQEKKDETKHCSGCGYEMPLVNRFCPNCGKEVDIRGNIVEKPVEAAAATAPAEAATPAPVEEDEITYVEPVMNHVGWDDDEEDGKVGNVVIASAPRKTFAENLADAKPEVRSMYMEILKYALEKEDTRESEAQYAVSVLCGRMKLLQIMFQRGKLICKFMAGSSELKKYSQSEKTIKIKEKPVIVEVDSKESLDAAKELVDISHKNIQAARNKDGKSKKENKVANEADSQQVVAATTEEKPKKKKKKAEKPVEEAVVETAPIEEPVQEQPAEEAAPVEAVAEPTPVEEVAQEPAPIEEPVQEQPIEEKPKKKKKAKKPVEEVAQEPAPEVEPVQEQPAPVEEVAQEPAAVEEVAVAQAEEQPVEEKPEEKPVKKTTKKATAAKTEKKAKPHVGKWFIEVKSEGEYMSKLAASNGEVMLSSEIYTTEEGARNGIATIIKNTEIGNFIAYQNKNGNYFYKLKTANNKLLCVGEIYKTKEQCLKAIESVKRIAAEATIAEGLVEDAKYIDYTPEKVENYEVKGKARGKWKVEVSAEGMYSAKLYASNGQLMLATEEVSTKATAKKAIASVKKYSADGNFIIDRDKFGRFYYKLRNAQKSVVCIGEAYESKESCISALESVRRFAAIADIVEDEETAE